MPNTRCRNVAVNSMPVPSQTLYHRHHREVERCDECRLCDVVQLAVGTSLQPPSSLW